MAIEATKGLGNAGIRVDVLKALVLEKQCEFPLFSFLVLRIQRGVTYRFELKVTSELVQRTNVPLSGLNDAQDLNSAHALGDYGQFMSVFIRVLGVNGWVLRELLVGRDVAAWGSKDPEHTRKIR